jgi:hypothetical protein
VNKTRILTVAIVVVAVVLCIGAVAAYGARGAADLTPPVTTSTIAASYAGEVSFDLHATDASGVSYVYWRVDKNKVNVTTVATDTAHPVVDVHVAAVQVASDDSHPDMVPLPMGTHAVKFWSQDTEGNVETQNVATITVTPDLSLASSAALVRANKTFKLSGTLEPDTVAHVGIEARRPGSASWTTLGTATSDAKGGYTYSYRTKITGTWSFRSAFQDAAKGFSAVSSTVKVKVR